MHKDSNETKFVSIRFDLNPLRPDKDGHFPDFDWAQLRRRLAVCDEPWLKMTASNVRFNKGGALIYRGERGSRAIGALLALQASLGVLPEPFLPKTALSTPDFKYPQHRH